MPERATTRASAAASSSIAPPSPKNCGSAPAARVRHAAGSARDTWVPAHPPRRRGDSAPLFGTGKGGGRGGSAGPAACRRPPRPSISASCGAQRPAACRASRVRSLRGCNMLASPRWRPAASLARAARDGRAEQAACGPEEQAWASPEAGRRAMTRAPQSEIAGWSGRG